MQRGNKHFVSFSGETIETTVVDKASIADTWLHNILSTHRHQLVVGLDCKFSPHPIRSMSGKIATLQLCLGTKCLVLQLLHMDHISQSVKNFLTNPNITFVGVEIHDNTAKLWNEYKLFCSKKLDIRALVKVWFPIGFCGKPSLRAIACELTGLGMRKTKKPFKRDWECKVLDQQHAEHACVDAYACYVIAHKVLKAM